MKQLFDDPTMTNTVLERRDWLVAIVFQPQRTLSDKSEMTMVEIHHIKCVSDLTALVSSLQACSMKSYAILLQVTGLLSRLETISWSEGHGWRPYLVLQYQVVSPSSETKYSFFCTVGTSSGTSMPPGCF